MSHAASTFLDMSSDSTNYNWVLLQLETFVKDAYPKNGSSAGYFTTQDFASCGRDEAIRQFEVVRPILEKLYPSWREENPASDSFEFQSEHDATQRLTARLNSQIAVERELSKLDTSPTIQASGLHPLVWEAAQAQWKQGFHADAVDAVARAVNSMLKGKTGTRDLNEVKLIQEAFSEKEPTKNRPRLRFDTGNPETDESVRRGAMDFGKGCFAAIRNPIAHLPDEEIDLPKDEAFEALAAFSLFARWIDKASLETNSSALA